MTPQEIESKMEEDINWLIGNYVGDVDKIDFLENLKDILFTAKYLGGLEESTRLKEEIEKIEIIRFTDLIYSDKVNHLICRKEVLRILEEKK